MLSTLHELGADVTIQLDKPDHELIEAFRREAGEKDFDVIVDYLWGPPTEALLAAITRAEFAFAGSETRLVEVGESAGPTITLPAAVLRSAALTILGTAGICAYRKFRLRPDTAGRQRLQNRRLLRNFAARNGGAGDPRTIGGAKVYVVSGSENWHSCP